MGVQVKKKICDFSWLQSFYEPIELCTVIAKNASVKLLQYK